MYFRQTNSDFGGKKNRILDKQTAPFKTIKHQRDKQILFVYRADFQSFNLFKEYQYSSSLNLFKCLYNYLIINIVILIKDSKGKK